MPTQPDSSHLRVAIIGGGPGGLAAAIALSSLRNVEINLYEKARELREIGAGLNIGYNSWRVLELLGADSNINGHLITEVHQRNGVEGTLLAKRGPSTLPLKYQSRRARRTRLQRALLDQVPPGIIHLRKELVSVENITEGGGARLHFSDGTTELADLIVGADGVRSVVRQTAFPDHKIKFSGITIWRTLVPWSLIAHIPDIPHCVSWWHGPSGHAYFSPVDDPSRTKPDEQMIEISSRTIVDPETDKTRRWSWGVPTTNEHVESHFTNFDPKAREALSKVPKGNWKEFSAFAGPRLEGLTAWDKLVLIGDASHPLTGAFGSGAAFAMEDAWILTRSLEFVFPSLRGENGPFISKQDGLKNALSIFNSIRTPYYARMYQHLDKMKAKATARGNTFEARLQSRVEAFSEGGLDWIYLNDIERVWKDWIKDQEELTKQENGGSIHIESSL